METEVSSNSKNPKKYLVPALALGSLVLIVSIIVVYFYQQSIVSGLNDDKAKLNSQISTLKDETDKLKAAQSSLNTRIAFLDKALREATASSKIEVGHLTVSVKAGTKHQATVDTPEGVIVDLEVKNNTNQTLYFSRFAMKLKDSQNHSYTKVFDPLDPNANSLNDQSVQPGETIDGSVFFEGASTASTFYTFYYEDQASTIAIK